MVYFFYVIRFVQSLAITAKTTKKKLVHLDWHYWTNIGSRKTVMYILSLVKFDNKNRGHVLLLVLEQSKIVQKRMELCMVMISSKCNSV
jgi:hypothetical protein